MMFTAARRAVIGGAAMLAIGAAGGVAVHGAISPSLTAATPSPSAGTGTGASPRLGQRECRPTGGLRGAAEQVLGIAVSVTGQSREQILDQLRQGRTLDQIAGSKASTIEEQALAKLKARLDQMVSSGRLTSDRESAMLARAKTALEKAMSSDLSRFLQGSQGNGMGARGCRSGNGLLGLVVKVTAEKTGLSQEQVLQDLRNGESIDQIAGSKAADIKATVLQMEQQRLSTELDRLMSRQGLGRGDRGPSHQGTGSSGGSSTGTTQSDLFGV
jgi:hypothetical protein